MSYPLVVKRYDSAARLTGAVRNYRWLAATELPVPRLIEIEGETGSLGFERIDGRHATSISDLERISMQLGRWHRRLIGGCPEGSTRSPFPHWIQPFLASRVQLLRTSQAPGKLLDETLLEAVATLAQRCPRSIYKDMNVRNVLVSQKRIHHVDFDDLSLAPAGYDLAKLLVSWAMTHGHRPPLELLLATYNRAACGELCDSGAFAVWVEIHHVLTSRYVGCGGYRHWWSAVRTVEDENRALAALTPLKS